MELSAEETGYMVKIEGENFQISEVGSREEEISFISASGKHRANWAKRGRELWVHLAGKSYHFVKGIGSQPAAAAASAERILRAPMPGQVREVFAQDGSDVGPGDVLLLLEAMKMEIRIHAPFAAKVARVAVKQGQTVEKEQVLVELEAE
ncbi:MAG: acetyl-CoA carboxylase biotin carboxyl carrier protein subunit [Anaerolineales bacterium]